MINADKLRNRTPSENPIPYAIPAAGSAGNLSSWIAPKIALFTRVMTVASGDVSYTGIGFKPSAVIITSTVDTAANIFSDGKANASVSYSIAITPSDTWHNVGAVVYIVTNAGATDFQYAVLKSLDTDGFTLTWVKGGAPTATISMQVMAFR